MHNTSYVSSKMLLSFWNNIQNLLFKYRGADVNFNKFGTNEVASGV